MDVAEVSEDEEWVSDPFTPIVQDGAVIGRGAADMKGGLAGALFAIQLLHESGIQLPDDLIFQSVIGEEVGEAGTLFNVYVSMCHTKNRGILDFQMFDSG